MADLPISGLPAITVVSSSYLLAAVSESITAQMTVKQVGDAYSSSLSGSFVPYTGATSNVDLGSNRTLRGGYLSASAMDVNDSFRINGNGSTQGGTLQFKQYSSIVSGWQNKTVLGAVNDDTLVATFYQTGSTNYKTVSFLTNLIPDDDGVILSFPSSSGTLALKSDTFPYTGSARITGSLDLTGSFSVSGSATITNTVIASRASIFDANYNTLIGGGVGVTGADNLVIGDSGLLNGTAGNYNIALGASTQAGITNGSYNISMGLSALEAYPTIFGATNSGSYNTVIGNYAMQYIGQGSYNVALGQSALQGFTARTGSASYNVAIGYSASFSASSAVNNVTIGYQAGSQITTGSYNTLVGAYAGSAFMSNNIVLSDGLGNVKFWYNSGSNGQIALKDDTQITGSLTVSGSVTQNNVISSLVKADSNGTLTAATGGADYVAPAYLDAYHTASLTVTAAHTPCTMSFSTTNFSYGGITISGSYADKIKFDTGGIYNIQFSAQAAKTTATTSKINIWLAKNGTEVPYSNTGVQLAGGANDLATPAWNFFVSASANDYYQLMFATSNDNAFIQYAPSGSALIAAGPAEPSLILTVNRIA